MASFKDTYMQYSARVLTETFDPAATGHIAIDLQKGLCQPPLALAQLLPDRKDHYLQTGKILGDIVDFSQDCQSHGVGTLWLKHTKAFTADCFAGSVPYTKDQRVAEALELFSMQAAELCVPANPENIIDKGRFNGFDKTALSDKLREKGIHTLLLTGGLGSVCVPATAKGAVEQGMWPFIISDLLVSGPDRSAGYDMDVYCEDRAADNIPVVTMAQVVAILHSMPKP